MQSINPAAARSIWFGISAEDQEPQEWEQGRRAPTEMARRGVLASIREIDK